MFGKSCLTLCLLLFCSAQSVDVDCSKFDASNCGLYYCVVSIDGCVFDECYQKNDSACVGDTSCRLVTLDFNKYNKDQTPKTFCINKTHHFSDCALTVEDLDTMYSGKAEDITSLEKYCSELGCGGLINIDERDETPHFYCDEPRGDGTVNNEDFNVGDCAALGYEYIVKNNECVYDTCLDETPGKCPEGCSERQVLDEDMCISDDRPVTICSKTFNMQNLTNETCISLECGELRVVQSIRGNAYFYCAEFEEPEPEPEPESCPPPKKNGALTLHLPFFAVLSAMAIFTLFF